MIGELAGNFVDLALDAAPWLLLGLLAAGLIKAWLPDEVIGRWLGGRGGWPVVKAAFVGAPLPLCSCGVVPAALALHRGGASRGATVSFLVATPETGVDSVAVSYAMLGPFMALVRPIAAILSAIATGLLAALVPEPAKKPSPFAIKVVSGSACNGGDCCAPKAVAPANAWQRTLLGLRYALTDILDDIALWLLLGLVAAAAIVTWLPPLALAEWGSGLPAMLLMVLVGIPMYICATASTPLAAGLLLAGVSPGTVLVFLLAGPATNLATLAILRKELGNRVLTAYLTGIVIASIAFGLLTDLLIGATGLDIPAQLVSHDTLIPHWFATGCALLLFVFAIKPLRRRVVGR
ncbi:MAG TPA: SO_0444 family Cu/Zn efflux transporter [Gammaproteobacteria bacterium]